MFNIQYLGHFVPPLFPASPFLLLLFLLLPLLLALLLAARAPAAPPAPLFGSEKLVKKFVFLRKTVWQELWEPENFDRMQNLELKKNLHKPIWSENNPQKIWQPECANTAILGGFWKPKKSIHEYLLLYFYLIRKQSCKSATGHAAQTMKECILV